jgi:hypothetical protein
MVCLSTRLYQSEFINIEIWEKCSLDNWILGYGNISTQTALIIVGFM